MSNASHMTDNTLRDHLVAVAKQYYGDDYNSYDNEAHNEYDYLFGLLCDLTRIVGNEGINRDRTEGFNPITEVPTYEMAVATLGPVLENVAPEYYIART